MFCSAARARVYRLYYSVAWRASLAGHWFWARLLLIPKVRESDSLRGEIEIRYAHSSVVLIASNLTIKAARSGATRLQREYDNYQAALEEWPALAGALLPVKLGKDRFATYLTMATCCSINDPSAVLERAVALYSLMGTCRRRVERGFELTRLPQIRSGIDELSKLYGKKVGALLEGRLVRLAGEAKLNVGFAHGDFHGRNILIAPGGDAKLIDLDCVRMTGIQQFDALNFVLEAEWSRSGKTWAQQIGAYLRNDVPVSAKAYLRHFEVSCSMDMALAYLVDRVGQEWMNYRFRYVVGDFLDPVSLLEGMSRDRAH